MASVFDNQYKHLEKLFEDQVELDRQSSGCDDIVYLPSFPKPNGKACYILIAMEPSLTKAWANPPNRRGAESAAKKGFQNFMPVRFEDNILHYCAENWRDMERQLNRATRSQNTKK